MDLPVHDKRVGITLNRQRYRLVRVINRMGRGYSFDALRAKILFAESAEKAKRTRYRRRSAMKMESRRNVYEYGVPKMFESDTEETLLGVKFSTLVRMIENGEI